MDSTKHHNECCKPDIGRGCTFCNCNSESEAAACEGCFKLHETAWLEEYPENMPTDLVEVRFKNTRRSYYQNVNNLPLKRGDIIAVEASPGHDIGIVSLTGDLVAKQMRRTGFNPFNGEYKKVYRKAKPFDLERWQEAIVLEHETMIQARQIAAEMGLNMKIGDVEYQGDKIKAIFYYIADERVDFRELIKVFAETFHIRIEMKQIGARQEAGRIGGLGACGRELCCASWISNFSSITTNAARIQEISLNPQKLAGQCSKLKCCLVYEYDTYIDARKEFPRLREPLQTLEGEFFLVKNDILAGTMSFSSSKDALANMITLPIVRVKEIVALNRAGSKVEKLQKEEDLPVVTEEPTYRSEEDSITRFDTSKRRNNKQRRNGDRRENTNKSEESRSERPQGEAAQEQKPRPPRPQGEKTQGSRPPRPQGDRPQGEKPQGNRPPRPQGEKTQGSRPPRPQGDRPQGEKPQGDRPSTGNTTGENARPRSHRGNRNNNRRRENNTGTGNTGAAATESKKSSNGAAGSENKGQE
ncbi:MAG: regulatory iron-sulfur-containing complex subunit RicT [Alistipes sp.]